MQGFDKQHLVVKRSLRNLFISFFIFLFFYFLCYETFICVYESHVLCVVVMGLVFLTFNPLFWLARVSCKKKLAEFIYLFFCVIKIVIIKSLEFLRN